MLFEIHVVHKEINCFVYHLKCMGEIMRVVTYIGREETVARKADASAYTHTHARTNPH